MVRGVVAEHVLKNQKMMEVADSVPENNGFLQNYSSYINDVLL